MENRKSSGNAGSLKDTAERCKPCREYFLETKQDLERVFQWASALANAASAGLDAEVFTGLASAVAAAIRYDTGMVLSELPITCDHELDARDALREVAS